MDISGISQQRDWFLNRIMARSPMLRFAPKLKGQGHLDVYKLFVGDDVGKLHFPGEDATLEADDMMAKLFASAGGSKPKSLQIAGVDSTLASRCRRLRTISLDRYHATGNWSLYLGYPLLYWKLQQYRQPLWAPLYFWKVTILPHLGKLYVSRPDEVKPLKTPDKLYEPELPRYNQFLKSLILREHGVQVEPTSEKFEYQNMVEHVEQIGELWDKCDIIPFSNKLRPFALPINTTGPTIYPFASIGLGSFHGEAIAEDLRRLSENIKSDSNTGCLKYLLRPIEKEDREATSPSESEKFIAVSSDPSQESILWQAAESKVTVIQGPPGTGKSQTIANLICSALARKDKIVVACHHDAALSVVKKRLDECGLGRLAIKINDPIQDRVSVIDSIRQLRHGSTLAKTSGKSDSERSLHCNNILQNEHALDNAQKILYGAPGEGLTPYGDLLAILHATNGRSSFDPYSPRNGPFVSNDAFCCFNNYSEANVAIEQVSRYVENVNICDYENNPWRFLIELDVDQSKLLGQIRELLVTVEKLETEKVAFHSVNAKWYAEHPMLICHYPGLTVAPLVQMQFNKLYTDISEYLSGVLPETVIAKWQGLLRTGNLRITLIEHLRKMETFDTLIEAEQLRRSSPMIRALYELGNDEIDSWTDFCRSAVAYNLIAKREAAPRPRELSGFRKGLREALQLKREDDQEYIYAQYSRRHNAADELQRAGSLRLRTGKRHRTELRSLYGSSFDKLSEIYPVLLTNFESACKLLPLEPEVIDTLIIDEASQVYTSDAMALLYRAKRSIISGDNMQMPPSDFFMAEDYAGSSDEEDSTGTDNDPELLKSLENTVGVVSSNFRMLKIHYRSSFPELIDFSNAAFYQGLLSVPTTNSTPLPFWSTPIEYIKVSGQFVDGVNQVEVVETIKILKSILIDGPEKFSIGVIVSNVRQRDRLLDALEKEESEDMSFRRALDISRDLTRNDLFEGFFVRSVEHVQGDERDIILYSTTYSDKSKNYGPLSRTTKGRRRLNVAITRAKMAMVVITSLNIDEISNWTEAEANDSEGHARERWFLWRYLSYAQAISDGNEDNAREILLELRRQSSSQDEPSHSSVGLAENFFERSVGEFLASKGYHVDYQVGVGRFRIDIGVKSKSTDRKYICGIECDGATYHSGWLARHRDIWRQDVLESKGWRFARVSSTTWLRSHTSALAKKQLLQAICNFSEQEIRNPDVG